MWQIQSSLPILSGWFLVCWKNSLASLRRNLPWFHSLHVMASFSVYLYGLLLTGPTTSNVTQFPLHLSKNPYSSPINPWTLSAFAQAVASPRTPSSLQASYIKMSSLQCLDQFLIPSWNLWWLLLCWKKSLPSLDSLSYLYSLKYYAISFKIYYFVSVHLIDFILLSSPLVMGS